ncbi:hypothetical protein ACGFIP_01295 [Micromonospora zamorensis]|uniref:hypothetical protein n=1 Tax=Micromonospora zamorensis TaxID=709883 RepID=UPI00370FC2B5
MTSYDPEREWTFTSQGGHTRTVPLHLYWELDGDPITDDWIPAEITAAELWENWLDRYVNQPTRPRPTPCAVTIYWSVQGPGISETAPFQDWTGRGLRREPENFLSFYTWPTDPKTDERLQWTRLPVVDKLWRARRADKGGFIQEHTGWKPSPLQATVDIDQIAQAAGVKRPKLVQQ